jgi:hypothetical protein
MFLVRKLICCRTTFSSATFTTHATTKAMHFPANAGLIFLTDELTNNRYLFDTGATLSIVPCNHNSGPSGPLLRGADGQPIPSWGFIKKKKMCSFKANFLHKLFCKQLWLVPSRVLTFYENSKSLFLQKPTKYSLLVQQRPSPPIVCLQRPRQPYQYFRQPHPPRLFCLARHWSQLRF